MLEDPHPASPMHNSRLALVVLLTLAIVGAIWLASKFESDARDGAHTASTTEQPGATLRPTEPPGVTAKEPEPDERVAADATGLGDRGPVGLLRVTARWQDEPAAGVMIYVRRARQSEPQSILQRGLADENGQVVFAHLPVGDVTLLSDRGDHCHVVIEGREQQALFELQDGITIDGTVTDLDGVAVGRASIWLQTVRTDWSGGSIVAQSNAHGAFSVRHVDPTASIAAIAPGYAPSALLDLDLVDSASSGATVALKLIAPGGRLEGRVTNSDGDAIAEALVAIGKRPTRIANRGRRIVEQWTPRTAITDDSGGFVIEGIRLGQRAVAIRASGYGFWRDNVAIEANRTTAITPTLKPAAIVQGKVTDDAGAAIEGAVIRVYDVEPGTSFLPGGEIEFDQTFGYFGARSDTAGHYRIDGVTPGQAWLFAHQDARDPTDSGVSVAFTHTTMTIPEGGELDWDPVIDPGLAIEGVALYRDGHPMSHVFVTLTHEQNKREHVLVSNAKGVFGFLCLGAGTYRVTVQMLDAPKDAPALQATGLVPGQGQIELRATHDKPISREPGSISGRIDDASDRITNLKAVVMVLLSEQRWFREGPLDGEVFRFENVSPGRYRVLMLEGRSAIAQTDWFEVLPAAETDFGVITTEPAGQARIRVVRRHGAEGFGPKLYLRRDGFARSTVVDLGLADEIAIDDLTPGNYTITGSAAGMVALRGQMRVVAGQTAEVELDMQPGARCRFAAWWPEGRSSVSRHYRILDRDGKVVHEYEGQLGQAATRPYPFSYTLPAGRWRIEFSTDDGLHGEAEFEVDDVASEVKVRIDLQ